MSEPQSTDLLLGDPGILTRPSVETVQATFAAMQRTVQELTEDCATVSETLDSLGDALNLVSQSSEGAREWGGLGMMGLPIVGAIKAVKTVAGQYVKERTGVSLDAWTDLVTSSETQFADYVAELSTVAVLADRHRHAPAEAALDAEQLLEDELTLRRLRWQGQIWKKILGRIARLGSVVDAILQADLFAEAPEPEATHQHLMDRSSDPPDKGSERAGRFGQTLRKQIHEVQNRTIERSGDWRGLVLQPFVDVRDRVRRLPAQTQTLAHEVALLELLLDLEMAQLRVCAGKASAAEADAVGVRVAATVLLPELARSVAEERQTQSDLDTYLRRLTDARRSGEVADRPFAILSEEYRDALQQSHSRLEGLDQQLQAWRRGGPEILRACLDTTDLELAVVEARRLAGEREEDGDHHAVLVRERERLDEAVALLSRL